MARSRTTKTLAKRIQLDYFTRPHPLRAWKARASWAAVAVCALVTLWWLMPSRRLAWAGGELTAAHAVLAADCGSCHGEGRRPPDGTAASLAGSGAGAGAVTDGACLACHAGPLHQKKQASSPACASCHAEHRGGSLTAVDDTHCAACHADLTTRTGPPEATAREFTSFPSDHPEFDAVAKGTDATRLRLNHRLHLKPGIRGAGGPVTLACASCHHPDQAGARMLPVTYERDCRSCHLLGFDTEGRFAEGTVVPHGDPNAVRDYLVDLYAGSAVAAASSSGESDPVARAIAEQRSRKARLEPAAYTPLSQPAGSDRAFVVERVGLALTVLQRQTCALCHGPGHDAALPAAAPPPEGLALYPEPPEIPKAAVPAAWMPGAEFSHRAHRALACAACHPSAGASEETSDVLVPGKAVCASCHHPGDGAPTSCITCHRYHPPEDDPLAPSRFALP